MTAAAIHALVLNLAAETTRMEFQRTQLERLGIPYSRVEAVTPGTLSPGSEDGYWQGWERPLRPTEMAAFASHRKAWCQIASGADPVLVLEDDALLLPGVTGFLEGLAPLSGVDHVTLETRGRRKLLARGWHPTLPMRRLWQDRTGAAAYVLWPSGAEKLLARTRVHAALADAAICAAYELVSWQADPARAIQMDQCDRWGISPPIPVRSTIDAVARPRVADFPTRTRAMFRMRRAMGQLRMAARRLSHPLAVRTIVAIGGSPD